MGEKSPFWIEKMGQAHGKTLKAVFLRITKTIYPVLRLIIIRVDLMPWSWPYAASEINVNDTIEI